METYKRREPQNTIIHKLIQEHYPQFAADHPGFPQYVYRTFEAFQDCGDLAKGFMRTKCSQCDEELVVAFSCKKRGFCSSCGAKRASETAGHLVDNILPHTRYRQIVLTLPFPLRFWCATNKTLLNRIYKTLKEALFRNLNFKAEQKGIKKPAFGSITWIQNWGSGLNLAPHFHVLLMESAWESTNKEQPILRNLPEWTNMDLEEVIHEVLTKTIKYLKKKGYLNESEEIVENPAMDSLFQDHDDLTNSLQASLHNQVAFGADAGRYVTRIGSGFGYREEIPVMKGRLCLSQNGFSIHGARVIRTNVWRLFTQAAKL